MIVRAKFTVTGIDPQATPDSPANVYLEPRYDETIPEDQRFAEATPAGRIQIYVNNPSALAVFKLGGVFYVDFIPVE